MVGIAEPCFFGRDIPFSRQEMGEAVVREGLVEFTQDNFVYYACVYSITGTDCQNKWGRFCCEALQPVIQIFGEEIAELERDTILSANSCAVWSESCSGAYSATWITASFFVWQFCKKMTESGMSSSEKRKSGRFRKRLHQRIKQVISSCIESLLLWF